MVGLKSDISFYDRYKKMHVYNNSVQVKIAQHFIYIYFLLLLFKAKSICTKGEVLEGARRPPPVDQCHDFFYSIQSMLPVCTSIKGSVCLSVSLSLCS